MANPIPRKKIAFLDDDEDEDEDDDDDTLSSLTPPKTGAAFAAALKEALGLARDPKHVLALSRARLLISFTAPGVYASAVSVVYAAALSPDKRQVDDQPRFRGARPSRDVAPRSSSSETSPEASRCSTRQA